MYRRLMAVALAAAIPVTVWGQLLSNIKVEPAQVKPGENVKITVGFDVSGGINCGLRLHYGDGETQDFKINQSKDVPLVVTRPYAKAGEMKVIAEPKGQGMVTKCGGKNQEATVRVAVPAAAAAPAPAAAAAAPASTAAKTPAPASKAAVPQCPQDWALVAKSVNRKTGAFTCTAKAGTKLPEGKLTCPGDLGYFENAAKRQLGCRP